VTRENNLHKTPSHKILNFQGLKMQIGLYTLSDLSSRGTNGQRVDAHTRIKETVAAAKLAEQAGVDIFGVGEHHRLDFAVSVPSVVLAAIAASTSTMRLTSAVTVLSTADPVRVYEEFATLDLVSSGRAEIIAGRGVFTEPFPLFGYDLRDYEALFDEKLALFDLLNKSERVTWNGRFREPLNDAEIAPRALQRTIPLWIGVGGSPDSAIRAGRLGCPWPLPCWAAHIPERPNLRHSIAPPDRRQGTPKRCASPSMDTFTLASRHRRLATTFIPTIVNIGSSQPLQSLLDPESPARISIDPLLKAAAHLSGVRPKSSTRFLYFMR
jgi:hypothetical protein